MIIFSKFEKLFNIIGQILAFLTVMLLGVLFINNIVPVQFITGDSLANLQIVKEYAVLITLIVCGLEFACKRSIFIFIPYVVIAALVFCLSFPALF